MFVLRLLVSLAVLSVMTGVGAYSTQYGPWWLLALLAVLGLILGIRALAPAGSQAGLITLLPGTVFYLILLSAAVLFDKTGLPGLQVQALSWLVTFLLVALTTSARALAGALAWSAAASVAFCAIVNLVEFFILPNEWSVAPGRSAGFLENPNISALALLGSWIVLYELRALVNARLILFAAALATMGLIVTFSRGGMVTAAVIALMILYRQWRTGRFKTSHLVWLAAVSSLIFLSLHGLLSISEISLDAWMRVNSLLTLDFSDDSSRLRSYLIEEYWRILSEHPISGFHPYFSISSTDGQGPHNNYLGLAVDFGIPVMLVFVAAALPGFLIRGAKSSETSSSGRSLILPTLILMSCMFSHNIAYSAIGAALLGAVAGLLARSRFEAASREKPICEAFLRSRSSAAALGDMRFRLPST